MAQLCANYPFDSFLKSSVRSIMVLFSKSILDKAIIKGFELLNSFLSCTILTACQNCFKSVRLWFQAFYAVGAWPSFSYSFLTEVNNSGSLIFQEIGSALLSGLIITGLVSAFEHNERLQSVLRLRKGVGHRTHRNATRTPEIQQLDDACQQPPTATAGGRAAESHLGPPFHLTLYCVLQFRTSNGRGHHLILHLHLSIKNVGGALHSTVSSYSTHQRALKSDSYF